MLILMDKSLPRLYVICLFLHGLLSLIDFRFACVAIYVNITIECNSETIDCFVCLISLSIFFDYFQSWNNTFRRGASPLKYLAWSDFITGWCTVHLTFICLSVSALTSTSYFTFTCFLSDIINFLMDDVPETWIS